jgi:hypothetical protein
VPFLGRLCHGPLLAGLYRPAHSSGGTRSASYRSVGAGYTSLSGWMLVRVGWLGPHGHVVRPRVAPHNGVHHFWRNCLSPTLLCSCLHRHAATRTRIAVAGNDEMPPTHCAHAASHSQDQPSTPGRGSVMLAPASRAGLTPSPTCLPGQGGSRKGMWPFRQRNGSQRLSALLGQADGGFFNVQTTHQFSAMHRVAQAGWPPRPLFRRSVLYSSKRQSAMGAVGLRHGKTCNASQKGIILPALWNSSASSSESLECIRSPTEISRH